MVMCESAGKRIKPVLVYFHLLPNCCLKIDETFLKHFDKFHFLGSFLTVKNRPGGGSRNVKYIIM